VGRAPRSRPRLRARPLRASSAARFLAEAGRLLARSLDHEASLATVARSALPALGALAIGDLVEQDGRMRDLSPEALTALG